MGRPVNRLGEFESVLAEVRSLQLRYAPSSALKSIAEQLEYLLGIERSKLSRINIGVLAARDVEDMDLNIANRLYAISAEVRRMAQEPNA